MKTILGLMTVCLFTLPAMADMVVDSYSCDLQSNGIEINFLVRQQVSLKVPESATMTLKAQGQTFKAEFVPAANTPKVLNFQKYMGFLFVNKDPKSQSPHGFFLVFNRTNLDDSGYNVDECLEHIKCKKLDPLAELDDGNSTLGNMEQPSGKFCN